MSVKPALYSHLHVIYWVEHCPSSSQACLFPWDFWVNAKPIFLIRMQEVGPWYSFTVFSIGVKSVKTTTLVSILTDLVSKYNIQQDINPCHQRDVHSRHPECFDSQIQSLVMADAHAIFIFMWLSEPSCSGHMMSWNYASCSIHGLLTGSSFTLSRAIC